MIDLNEVLVFIKVVEAGSFSGAANILGFPRSTVSRKVSQLEDSLGMRLLQRSTRKLSLTPAGREYYLKCSNALTEIEHANQTITEAQQSPSGVLRIAAPLASQSGFMCDWINEFLSLHNKVTGQIRLSDDNVDLIEEGVDVAFRAGKLQDSSLVARKLGSTQLVLCASPQYLNNSSPLNTFRDLKQHDCIVFGSPHQNVTWKLNGKRGIEAMQVSGRIVVNSMEFALQASLTGLGVAMLPIAMIANYISSNDLQIVLEDYSSDADGLYAVYPSNRNLSITARCFLDFIASKASQGLPWDKLIK